MKYKNTKTGAIIDSLCIISGGDWIKQTEEVEEIFEEIEEIEEVKEIEKTEEVEEIDGIEGITVKEIKQELDAFGIKYNPRANKQELYDLMIKGR